MAGANGTTLSSYTYLPTVADPDWTIAGTADFDADGNPDILWRNVSNGMNAIWYLTSANGFTMSSSASLPAVTDPAWTIAGIADFDADGKPDILWRNTSTGDNAVWYMTGENGSTVSSYEYLPPVADSAWGIVGTADFNADGIPDILWRNTSGDNAIWYMTGEKGSTLSSYEYLPPVTDTAWNIVGTTDLDEDGKPDILWRNALTGDNAAWYMTGDNGSTFSSWEYLPIVADQDWTVVGLN
jgi:hypothetical protein